MAVGRWHFLWQRQWHDGGAEFRHKRVMPAVVQQLMRHASIETTMGRCVDLDVDEVADDLWAQHPATAGAKPAERDIPGNIGLVDGPALTEGADAKQNNEKTCEV